MARSRKSDGFGKSQAFDEPDPAIEDEILEIYSELTESSPDFFLNQLLDLFNRLNIQECFTKDIAQCVEYYYRFIQPVEGLKFDPTNVKQYTTINLLKAYTISANAATCDDLIDIVDIDKLLRNVTKLVKMRNNYNHIYDSWKLFVAAASSNDRLSNAEVLVYKLSLPDLKTVKTSLNLDPHDNGRVSFGDALLIDMLSCCSTDSHGNIINFDFAKPKTGSYVSIKDFGEILGQLGELD